MQDHLPPQADLCAQSEARAGIWQQQLDSGLGEQLAALNHGKGNVVGTALQETDTKMRAVEKQLARVKQLSTPAKIQRRIEVLQATSGWKLLLLQLQLK
jgi:hypothetical protein